LGRDEADFLSFAFSGSIVIVQDLLYLDFDLGLPRFVVPLSSSPSFDASTADLTSLLSPLEGGAIMIMSLLLFETEFQNIVAISFTALILNELIMVALEITTW